ncbi:MAG: DNA primase, partial [Alistipes sp.]|nr:DNA primase [Alistipes sp.]
GVGVEIDTAPFVCHPDPDVCRVVARMVDLETHRLSSLWTKKEVHVTTLEDVLAVGVPKSVMLYRTKVVDQMTVDLAAKLASGELDDEETLEVMRSLDRLNAVKQSLAAKSQRLIV